jgi:hypothetical protein
MVDGRRRGEGGEARLLLATMLTSFARQSVGI